MIPDQLNGVEILNHTTRNLIVLNKSTTGYLDDIWDLEATLHSQILRIFFQNTNFKVIQLFLYKILLNRNILQIVPGRNQRKPHNLQLNIWTRQKLVEISVTTKHLVSEKNLIYIII